MEKTRAHHAARTKGPVVVLVVRSGSLTLHARVCGASIAPRPFGSSTAAAGILDCMVCAYPEGWGAGGPWITGWVP